MADFCSQCSIDLFGEDSGDLKGLTTEEDIKNGLYAMVLCEGCGPIQVNHLGHCVSTNCMRHHNKPDPKPEPIQPAT